MLQRTINGAKGTSPRANRTGLRGSSRMEREMTVTTHNEAKLKTFDAFAPFADALEAMLNLEVPGVARDFAKRMTGAGEKLMTDGRGAVENATATIENAAVSSIREFG